MADPLGTSPGSVDIPGATEVRNDVTTIPDVPVAPETDRVAPRQVATGTQRGTQTIMNTDGSYVTLGLIPNSNDFGVAFFDATDHLISKNTATTQYIYDVASGKNIIQIGKLPDGTYGMAVAKSGYNVSDAITA
jgi:hypothetical protein